ncbi:MAG: ADP-heptose:LPS heptosyltransferase-like protein [Phycisphaerales bacterium]|nr:ADP-heptose:LPS heptosyltransferase-like protein [Phycisphaerales bacterium]
MKLLLVNHQSPGDVLMLTAAVRDLHRAHPGKFMTAMDTSCPPLWLNNPYVVGRRALGKPDRIVDCQYPLVHEANRRPFHFIHGFAQDLERKLNVRVPVTEFRSDIHLSQAEMRAATVVQKAGHERPYWVLVAGGKYDFTTKWWNPEFFQAVVDHFAGRIQFVQCGDQGHWHPALRGVLNLVGRTDLRELVRVIWGADGVICPVTLMMHLAAGVPPRPGAGSLKPCVVIAGGREPPHWEMYLNHQFLHTVGALPCCATGGCWKSRCQPLGDGDPKDADLCAQPVRVSHQLHIARCMELVTPQRVIDAVELYLKGNAMTPNPLKAQIPASRSSRSSGSVEIRVKPRGVAVTIGVGRFEKLARLAAAEMRELTGLKTVVLGAKELKESGLESPLFLKFRIFDLIKAENVFYFDADVVCLERWDPAAYFGDPALIAVRDRMGRSIVEEAAQWGIPLESYFNGGMFIANVHHHRQWLQLAESIRFEHPTLLVDQSPLNAARHRLGLPLKLLSRSFNWLGFGASSLSHDVPVVMAHKLAPDRIDINLAYLKGEHELLGPRVVLDHAEADLLAGRTLRWVQEGRVARSLTFREDGTLLPVGDPEDAGYWFIHIVSGRPTLALASESKIMHQFIEKYGGDWISTGREQIVLRDQARHQSSLLTSKNARCVADDFVSGIGGYPADRYRERGIVICGGGEKYLPCAWVLIQMLRHLKCQLPIELWLLRDSEISRKLRLRLEQKDVRCVNAAEVRRHYPVRHLGGWEIKPYSILYSSFEQALYLDADNVPIVDPTFLFDTEPFKRTGAVFWPDYGRLGRDRAIWRICWVKYRDEPEFESGQILVDKRRCWKSLNLTMHLNEHSDFYYRHFHGDKESFHMAWHMLDQEYAMVPHPIHSLPGTMCQHDFEGRRIFQHRNGAKWSINGSNRRIEGFEKEELCLRFIRRLTRHWEPLP